jgi:hypothetical protein
LIRRLGSLEKVSLEKLEAQPLPCTIELAEFEKQRELRSTLPASTFAPISQNNPVKSKLIQVQIGRKDEPFVQRVIPFPEIKIINLTCDHLHL